MAQATPFVQKLWGVSATEIKLPASFRSFVLPPFPFLMAALLTLALTRVFARLFAARFWQGALR